MAIKNVIKAVIKISDYAYAKEIAETWNFLWDLMPDNDKRDWKLMIDDDRFYFEEPLLTRDVALRIKDYCKSKNYLECTIYGLDSESQMLERCRDAGVKK